MDNTIPQIILYALTAIGAVVWLWSASYLLAASRIGREPSPLAAERFTPEDPTPPRDLITGSMDVAGNPAELSAKAAAQLAQLGVSGALKILERMEDRVVLEGLSRGNVGFGLVAGAFRRGLIRFSPGPYGKTRIDYAVETPGNGRVLLWCGAGFQVAGLIALIVGFWLLHTYALNNLNPGARWQTVQMVQTCHFLWPPFLFGSIYKRQARGLRDGFDALLHNLPYTSDAPGLVRESVM